MPCQYFFPRRDYPQAAYYLIRSATKRWSRLEKKSLELAITSDTRRRHTARLSLSVNAQKAWVRKKTRRWHAAFAGAVAGGIAVLFETSGRRVTIGQQMFVRGLQGTFNAYTTAKNIKIPHGDVILFALM